MVNEKVKIRGRGHTNHLSENEHSFRMEVSTSLVWYTAGIPNLTEFYRLYVGSRKFRIYDLTLVMLSFAV